MEWNHLWKVCYAVFEASYFFRTLYPFALRRMLHDAKYRILGRTYVNGLMDGEIFDLYDFEKHGYKTFTIA